MSFRKNEAILGLGPEALLSTGLLTLSFEFSNSLFYNDFAKSLSFFYIYFSCTAGAGIASSDGSSGAGHGGNGGRGKRQTQVGVAYGHLYEPQHFGCRGGGSGGLGGGIIRMSVNGTLQIDGTISCNGANGQQDRSGGGSGGSIWIETDLMKGYGTVQANGGDGDTET